MSSVCGFGDSDYFSSYGSGRGGYSSSDLDDSVGESPVSQRRTVSVSSDEGIASFGQSYNSCHWSNGINSDEQQVPIGQGDSWEELVVFRTAQSLAKLRLLESESERPKKAVEEEEDEPRGRMFNAFWQQMSVIDPLEYYKQYASQMMLLQALGAVPLQRQSPPTVSQRVKMSYAEVHNQLSEIHASGTRPGDQVLVHQDRATARNVNRRPRKSYCEFCYNNMRALNENNRIPVPQPTEQGKWSTHLCKAPNGDVICPVLFAHVCKDCGATGAKAHTIRYCPVSQQRKFDRKQKRG